MLPIRYLVMVGYTPALLTFATILVLAQGQPASAQSVLREGFDGPQPTWQWDASDVRFRDVRHERVGENPHSGSGCEHIQLVASNGSFVYVQHPIGAARVIDELNPSVWVRSDRPGIQLLAGVVFPHTQDPATGRALRTLLRGTIYTDVGRWQELRLEKIPTLLSRQVRVLRSELGPNVEPREAYVDRLVLNVYGGSGATSVWIDDLAVAGRVDVRGGAPAEAARQDPPPQSASSAATRLPPTDDEVRLQGSVLIVGGRPMLPRIIRHQGETLALLQSLGFNVVQLATLPEPRLLDEARRLKMWLICPPPSLDALEQPDSLEQPDVLRPYDRVLAWELGSGLTRHELPQMREWARAVRRLDPRAGRPLLGEPESDVRAYSRMLSAVVLGRRPLATSIELNDYEQWLKQRARLAQPGTPLWIRVQTDLDSQLRRQWAMLSGGRLTDAPVDERQVRWLVRTALAAGARGLLFDSQSPLSAEDPATRQRALTLQLVNLELELIEPWAARGSFIAPATCSDGMTRGVMLQADRARLLLPIRSARGGQFVPGSLGRDNCSFVIPGVPEANRAYELTPVGLEPIHPARVAGGVRIAREPFNVDSLLLMTSDARVVAELSQRTQRLRPRAAQLLSQLAAEKAEWVADIDGRLRGRTRANTPATSTDDRLVAALRSVDQSKLRLQAQDHRTAYREARKALANLGDVQWADWHRVIDTWPSPIASPFAVHLVSLPHHGPLAYAIRTSDVPAQTIRGGDFESLDALQQTGWLHFEHVVPSVSSHVELSPVEPHSGRYSLKMRTWSDDSKNPDPFVETAPVWVTSAPVQVPAGQLVRVRGWVRVPKAVQGSLDGLMIIDSAGGQALAERIRQTDEWKAFSLYRAVPPSGEITVTFALTGLGEVWVDDVSIDPIGATSPSPPPAQASNAPNGLAPARVPR